MDELNKKILFIIPNLAKGGAERVLSSLTQAIGDKFKIDIALYEDRIDYNYRGNIIILNTPPSANPIVKLYNLAKRLLKISYIKNKKKYLACISFLESANIVNILTRQSETVIVSVREDKIKTMGLNPLYKKIYDFLIKLLYKKSNKIVAASNGISYGLTNFYGVSLEKIKVIYNPIFYDNIQENLIEDLSVFSFLQRSSFLVTAGRLTKQKCQWSLVRIFKNIKKKFSKIKTSYSWGRRIKGIFDFTFKRART